MRSLVCKGHRHHGVDFLLHDAHAALEGVVELGVADEDGGLSLRTRSRTAVLMRKPSPLWALRDELVAFEDHEHAALGADGLDGEVEHHREKLVERAVVGEFLAGADEGLHGGGGLGSAALDGHGLVREGTLEAGDDGGGSGRAGLAFEDDHSGGVGGVGGVDDHEVAGGDAIAGFENQARLEGDVVDEGAVFAAQVLHGPFFAVRFEGEVLAGKAGVFGKAQLGGAGAADGQAASGERNGFHLPIRTLDEKFTGHGAFLGNGDKHSL